MRADPRQPNGCSPRATIPSRSRSPFTDGVLRTRRSDAGRRCDTILVCGFLGCDLRPFNPLVAALPRMLHLPAERRRRLGRAGDATRRWPNPATARPGSDAVLERLSEMMFVDAARRYLDTLPEDAHRLARGRCATVSSARRWRSCTNGRLEPWTRRRSGPARSACRARHCTSASCSDRTAADAVSDQLAHAAAARACCAKATPRWRRSRSRSATTPKPRSRARSSAWSAAAGRVAARAAFSQVIRAPARVSRAGCTRVSGSAAPSRGGGVGRGGLIRTDGGSPAGERTSSSCSDGPVDGGLRQAERQRHHDGTPVARPPRRGLSAESRRRFPVVDVEELPRSSVR